MHKSEGSLPPPTMTKLIRKGALSFGEMKDMGGYVVGDRGFMMSTPFKQNHPGRLSERPERWKSHRSFEGHATLYMGAQVCGYLVIV